MSEHAIITEVRIRNFMSLRVLDIFAGNKAAAVTGQNASGKTSVRRAIETALKKGHDATVIHTGEDAAEVLIKLSTGESVEMRVTPKRTTRTVRGADGQKMASPSDWIADHFDVSTVNPLELLDAKMDRRLQLFGEGIGGSLQRADVEAALHESGVYVYVDDLEAVPANRPVYRLHPGETGINQIKDILKFLVGLRSSTGSAKNERAASVKRLYESLPSDDEPVDMEALRADIDNATNELETIGTERAEAKSEEVERIRARSTEQKSGYETDLKAINDQIRELEARRERAMSNLATLDNDGDVRIAEAEARINEQYEDERVKRRLLLNNLQQQATIETERANTRRILRDEIKEESALRERWNTFRTAITAVKELRQKLFASLSMPGVDIDDEMGEIMIDGIPWDNVNTARRLIVGVQLAALRGAKVIMIDNAERADSERLALLIAEADRLGMQIWTFAVTDDPELTVESNLFSV